MRFFFLPPIFKERLSCFCLSFFRPFSRSLCGIELCIAPLMVFLSIFLEFFHLLLRRFTPISLITSPWSESASYKKYYLILSAASSQLLSLEPGRCIRG